MLSISSPKVNISNSSPNNIVTIPSSPHAHIETTDSEDICTIDLSFPHKSVDEFKPPIHVNVNNGRFMSARGALQQVTRQEKVFDICPPGNKSNVWFLVDNQSNIQPGHQKRTYYDNCGIWNSSKGRTHILDYLISDNFRVVFNK